jgi:carboxymethylenebutenolidase
MARREQVEIKTPDGRCDAYLSRPDLPGEYPGVLMFMDGIGIRETLLAKADQLAELGFVVLLPNVFYRTAPAPILDFDRLLKPEHRPELMAAIMPLISGYTPASAALDDAALIAYLRRSPEVRNTGGLGAVGYCMGGALAVRVAAAHPDEVRVVASFHGGNLAPDSPDGAHRLLGRVRAELYFGHAENDHSMPAEQIARLEQSLREHGLAYRSEIYSGAAHGYTMVDIAAYNPAALERHWRVLAELLPRTLA